MYITKAKLKEIITEEISKLYEGDVVQGNFGKQPTSLDQGEYSKPADVVQGDFSQSAKDEKEKKLKELSMSFNGLIYAMMTDRQFKLGTPKDIEDNPKIYSDYQTRFSDLKNQLGLSEEEIYKRVDEIVVKAFRRPELFLTVKNFVKKLLDKS